MRGQVFTVAKLHYINGVVYFTAQESSTDVATLAQHYTETTKSGNVKHPKVRVQTLVRLAEGLGLIVRQDRTNVHITELGRRYYDARAKDKWSLSARQQELLREHILSDPSHSPTIHSIKSLLALVKEGQTGKELTRQYATAIEKQDAWQSDVTYEGFTKFGLDYLKELGFIGDNISLGHFSTSQNIQVPRTDAKNTFLFTWNPNKWKWEDLPQAVYEANAEGRYLGRWSCGVTRNITPGDRAFLMRLGEPPKGIMGSGIVVSELFEDIHWDTERAAKGEKVHRVEILFDVLSDLPIIPEEILVLGQLAEHNWFPQASATRIPTEVAEQLEKMWSRTTGTVFNPPEIDEIPRLRIEGTRRSRLVTIYERNSQAREECLRYHGSTCHACGFIFEKQYGQIGKGFIHIHHAVPVSEIQQEYEVDPAKDLFPVCPNCHAMLHKRTPPYTIAELKEIISVSSK
jgi:5-methylcytosine-specific restriction protein A